MYLWLNLNELSQNVANFWNCENVDIKNTLIRVISEGFFPDQANSL